MTPRAIVVVPADRRTRQPGRLAPVPQPAGQPGAGAAPARTRGMVAASMVLSLMLAAAVALAAQLLKRATEAQERESLTMQHMERIRAALCSYHLLHNGFPNSGTLDLPGRITPPSTPGVEPSNLPPGSLPPLGWTNPDGSPSLSLQHLGLGPDDVTDGWGRLIAVRLSNSCATNADPLQIDLDGDGIDDTGSTKACVVLISHGRTGRGAALPQASAPNVLAWLVPPAAGSSPADGEGAEWRNTRRNLPASSPYQAVAPRCTTDRSNPDSPCHFDDRVVWFDKVKSSDTGSRPLCRH